MADTGLTEVTATIEQMVAAEVQEVLTANVVIPGTIMDQQVGPGIDRVKIPRFGNFSVDTKAENVDVTPQVNAFSTDDLLLNQHKVIQTKIEDIAELQSKVAVSNEYINQSGRDLAADMDLYCINELETGTSASAPDHRIAYAGSSLAKADILEARKLLNEQNVPQGDRTLLVSPASESSLMSITEFTRVDESGGSAALRNGQIGKLFGFDVLMSSQVEDLKTMAYHRTAAAMARQLAPRVERQRKLQSLADLWSIDHIFGCKTLDSGKRQVLLGTAV